MNTAETAAPTREEIEKMPAGTELDVLVHEKVLGLCAHSFKVMRCTAHDDPNMNMYESIAKCHCDSDYPPKECVKCGVTASGLAYRAHYTGPKHSADIAAAWPLFAGKGWLLFENKWNDANAWFIFKDERALADWLPIACAPTVELAICRAALIDKISVGGGPSMEGGKAATS